jgi:hypothetical protein
MNRFLTYVLLSLPLAFVPTCARLPEYAQPRMVQADEPQKTLPTAFPYRELTQADFRATSLLEQQAELAERINAHTATLIRVTADSSFRITSGDLYGKRYFFGKIEHLSFEAVMLPDRSWWNPKIPANMQGYVLHHEQIHFALMELAARRLTIDIQKWASEVLVMELTPQEVQAELFRQIKDRINAAMEVNLKRQAEFDEDTSLFFSPKRQQWWSLMVEEELKQTNPERKVHERTP